MRRFLCILASQFVSSSVVNTHCYMFVMSVGIERGDTLGGVSLAADVKTKHEVSAECIKL